MYRTVMILLAVSIAGVAEAPSVSQRVALLTAKSTMDSEYIAYQALQVELYKQRDKFNLAQDRYTKLRDVARKEAGLGPECDLTPDQSDWKCNGKSQDSPSR